MRQLLAIVVIVTCTLSYSGYVDKAKKPDLCAQWAVQTLAGSDDITMHTMGCDDKTGTYKRAEGRCMRIAYRVALHYNGDGTFFRHVGQQGCVLYEDGSWGNE